MFRWMVLEGWLKGRKPRRGAEIGVKEGRLIAHMLGRFPDLTMYAVDPWEDQPGQNEDYIGWDWTTIYSQYQAKTRGVRDRVVELREYSESAAGRVPDASLDFVFIDAQHDYDSVVRDIELWRPKVKPGGLVSGHDYEPNFPGVIKAVNEAFKNPFVGSNAVWGIWC